MRIEINGIAVIVGDYGSGKTEVSINLALERRHAGVDVRIADLDLVNPYFRTREARHQLQSRGIGLVLPPAAYLHADLPVLSPAIAGLIRDPSPVTILDVGGDDAGAMVLAALADAFKGQDVRMLQVVNPFRPHTETVEGCLQIQTAIASAARLPVGGWIVNAHLMDETTMETIVAGHRFGRRLAEASGLPLVFITAPQALSAAVSQTVTDCPVLAIRRQLVPPWKQSDPLAAI
ncbi:MAG: cobalamin biosynthesis protein CbiA [Desulfosarcina sp.]|nr:cobalamin biosynthesis protein CbiA [Desulfobacterales bacterium]